MVLGERDERDCRRARIRRGDIYRGTTARMFEDYVTLLTWIDADPERESQTISLTRGHEIEQLSAAFAANLEV